MEIFLSLGTFLKIPGSPFLGYLVKMIQIGFLVVDFIPKRPSGE